MSAGAMRPLAEFPLEARRAIRGVLTDIDDTLTTHGQLLPEAYAALARLRAAGRLVIPVTGRPAGWCDHIARMWPVDAVVGENGAFWFRHDPKAGRLVKRYVIGEAERSQRAARLEAIARRVLSEVPGSAIASDQAYREADLAIDFCEDVRRLPREAVARIVAIMEAEGLTAKVSSIHVNGWFGGYDKLSTSRLMLREDFGIDLDREREHYRLRRRLAQRPADVRVLPHSVGVANVREMADLMQRPAGVDHALGGSHGFAELADALLPTQG
jgi:HAD superfamily hydrolase (TIGR01484 family)